MDNPAQTRHELCVKFGVREALAAEVFALTVFLCDDLLQRKPGPNPIAALRFFAIFHFLASNSTARATTRFFTIASKLPVELQMVLCHRVVGSMKPNIPHKDSKAAFKSLARLLLSQPE